MRVRVNSRTHNHLVGRTLFSEGEQSVEVGESEVAVILAEVEDEGAVREAEARLAAYRDAVARKKAGAIVPDTAIPSYPLSLPAVFRAIHGREIKPFVAARVEQSAQPQKGR